MSRMFKIDATRTEYLTVWVEAESFDEARDKFYNGMWDDYDDYDHDNEDLDTIECTECGESESWCECREESENPEADAPGKIGPGELRVGTWVEPDEYTALEFFHEDDPVKITYVGETDCDGDTRIEFTRINGEYDYWYVGRSGRFREVPEPEDVEGRRAEAERERERMREEEERRREKLRQLFDEQRYVSDLLNI